MITLSVPAEPDYRDLVTRAVATACRVASAELGHDRVQARDLSNAMVSAVGEAFNNVVEHAYGGKGGVTRIAIERDERVMRVEVTDEGAAFDLDAVPSPDLASLPESGMGVYIIRAFVDEVRYVAGPVNTLSMTKRLPMAPTDSTSA